MHEERVVKCWHCDQYDCLYVEKEFAWQPFLCEKKRKMCRPLDDVCDQFALRKGLHTDKWYPGKEG